MDVYRELMNWRRSLPKYAPKEDQQRVLDLIREQGAVSVAEVRKLFGIKKGAADARPVSGIPEKDGPERLW